MLKRTILLRLDPDHPSKDIILAAADLIKRGGCVAFPTETVYGLGADALNPDAVLGLFVAKERPLDNPPIVHVSQEKEMRRLVKNIPPEAHVLMDCFWPGPLTLIFKRSAVVPSVTVAGLDTIAIRMPQNRIALGLIENSGCPIAAPSANLAGKPSPTTAQHVMKDLGGRIDAVLDGGPTEVGLESTVVDLTSDPPEILRPGGVSFESLKQRIEKIRVSRFASANEPIPNGEARSPGMKHKHYAPNSDMWLVEGELEPVIRKIRELSLQYQQNGKRVGILATEETRSCYGNTAFVKVLGSRCDLLGMAKRLFGILREFDYEDVDVIIGEGLPTEGLGLALMNRLRKAAGHKIVRVSD